MRRLWSVTVTIVEDWEVTAAVATLTYEVLAVSAQDAEAVLTRFLAAEYAGAETQVHYTLSEFTIFPLLCDVNAIRDGRYDDVRCVA